MNVESSRRDYDGFEGHHKSISSVIAAIRFEMNLRYTYTWVTI